MTRPAPTTAPIAPETVLRRVRQVVGTAGVERLDPAAVRLILRELLFDGDGVPDWHHQAACRDADPELFDVGPSDRVRAREAKGICAGCPVRVTCLADTLAWERPGYRHGIAGGLTAAERHRLVKRSGGAAA